MASRRTCQIAKASRPRQGLENHVRQSTHALIGGDQVRRGSLLTGRGGRISWAPSRWASPVSRARRLRARPISPAQECPQPQVGDEGPATGAKRRFDAQQRPAQGGRAPIWCWISESKMSLTAAWNPKSLPAINVSVVSGGGRSSGVDQWPDAGVRRRHSLCNDARNSLDYCATEDYCACRLLVQRAKESPWKPESYDVH